MSLHLAPSLMSMNLLDIRESLRILDPFADSYHVDILDWHYVKNMCLTPHFIKQIRPITKRPIEAHLYVDNVDVELISHCIDSGADIITVPTDIVSRQVHRYASLVHDRGCEFGVFLNPSQEVSTVSSYAGIIDVLLLLSVDPGFGGQAFLEDTYRKLNDARTLRDTRKLSYRISVDGGCSPNNYAKLSAAGADALMLGSSLFEADSDLSRAIQITYEQICAASGQRPSKRPGAGRA